MQCVSAVVLLFEVPRRKAVSLVCLRNSLLVLQLAMAKDPEAAFFKRLEGLQPCEISELKAGTHIFAVYG